MPSAPKHFLEFGDFSREEFDYLFERTRWIKERFKRYELYQPLRDRTLAMVFEKASTRTRVSFEAGMNQLGGIAINLNRGDTQLSRGEPIEDVARVISRMVDVVMIRTFEQSIIAAVRRAFARAGDQRADERISSLPDPGGRFHLARASRDRSPGRRSRGSATRTTSATRGCRPRASSSSASMCRRRPATRSTLRASASTRHGVSGSSPTRSTRAAARTS